MVSSEASPFFEHVTALPPVSGPSEADWLTELRKRGMEHFREAGLPGPREEAWRFTSLKALQKERFIPAEGAEVGDGPELSSILEFAAHRFVFVNGIHVPHLSRDGAVEPGLRIDSLARAWSGANGLADELGSCIDLSRHRFGALNTAFMRDGALIRIAAGVRAETPIHLLFLSRPGDTPIASYPRVLVVAEEGAEVTVIEEHIGGSEGRYFSSAVTEIAAHANASVKHVKMEREGTGGIHIGATAVDLARDARYSGCAISLSGKLVRADLDAVLGGEGAECRLDGLYLAEGRRHVDHHTWIEHATPHTTSHEHYKGVLDDRATAVFNGRVVIRPQAQKTEAGQTNNNLLLSEDALVNTNPELEIFADDVKAQHGATVGQLDEEHLFYLRSRGLDEPTARRVLIQAFAGEMIDRVPHAGLREKLTTTVSERF